MKTIIICLKYQQNNSNKTIPVILKIVFQDNVCSCDLFSIIYTYFLIVYKELRTLLNGDLFFIELTMAKLALFFLNIFCAKSWISFGVIFVIFSIVCLGVIIG